MTKVDCGEVKVRAIQLSDPENEQISRLFQAIGMLKLSVLKSRGVEVTKEAAQAWSWSNQHHPEGRWLLIRPEPEKAEEEDDGGPPR